MEIRFSIRHGLISFSYPAYFKFSVTIGSLALGTSFPLPGGFGTAPVRNVRRKAHIEKRLKINFNLFPKHYLN